MKFRQTTPWERFPSGDSCCLAVLCDPPEELSTQYGIRFEKGVDNFDLFQLAAVELENGERYGQFWLFRYQNSPEQGTEVLVDSEADLGRALQSFMTAFGLDFDDLVWVYNMDSEAGTEVC